MIRRRLLNRSLANRYTLLATLLVLFTTLVLGFASASGVYRMALREETARERAQCEILISEVAGRLQTSNRVLRTLSLRDVLKSGDDAAARRALAAAFASNAEYLHGVVIARPDGTVLNEYPAGAAPRDSDVHALAGVASLSGEYRWIPAPDGRGGSLWVAVLLETEAGDDRVLLGEVRTAFIDNALRQLALSGRQPTAFLVDADGTMLFAAGDPEAYRNGTVSYLGTGDSAALGGVEIAIDDAVQFNGVYGDITGFLGIEWRSVVVEPADVAAGETWLALRPAMLAWGFSAAFVTILTVVGVGFLVRPLRLLDSKARAAASGALLEPLAVTRRDEVGRLIESFNSVAERLRRMHDVSQLLARSAVGTSPGRHRVLAVAHAECPECRDPSLRG